MQSTGVGVVKVKMAGNKTVRTSLGPADFTRELVARHKDIFVRNRYYNSEWVGARP